MRVACCGFVVGGCGGRVWLPVVFRVSGFECLRLLRGLGWDFEFWGCGCFCIWFGTIWCLSGFSVIWVFVGIII